MSPKRIRINASDLKYASRLVDRGVVGLLNQHININNYGGFYFVFKCICTFTQYPQYVLEV